MYVPKSLKLNQFRICQIPSAKDLIKRYGFNAGSNYSGDDIAPTHQQKLDLVTQLDAENGNRLAKELAEQDNS